MARCPRCGSPTVRVELPYAPLRIERDEGGRQGPQLAALLDNIRSTFNVGAMFRTADGAGLRHLYLGGITPTPDHPKIAKTALGAEQAVPWTQEWDAQSAARRLKGEGYELWALEGGPEAENLFTMVHEPITKPILLVVGNEVSGVDPGILALCDRRVFLPMTGMKESLNVAIAFSITAYLIRFVAMISEEPGTDRAAYR